MTIRRHVDIAAINADFMAFELACQEAPAGQFEEAKAILFMIGTQADALLGSAKGMDLGLVPSNCDGIREVEAMMFDLLRRGDTLSFIETAIRYGHSLEEEPDLDDDAERFGGYDEIDGHGAVL